MENTIIVVAVFVSEEVEKNKNQCYQLYYYFSYYVIALSNYYYRFIAFIICAVVYCIDILKFLFCGTFYKVGTLLFRYPIVL